jgi:hypothetical protein
VVFAPSKKTTMRRLVMQKKLKWQIVFFVFTLIFLELGTAYGAQVWDLWDDVAGPTNTATMEMNPNGVWSYFVSAKFDIDASNYEFMTNYYGNCGQTQRACHNYADTDPSVSISKVTGDYTANFNTAVTIPGGSVFVHPSHILNPNSMRYVIIRWTSPIAGSVQIQTSFNNFDGQCGNGIDWFVRLNNANLSGGTGTLSNGGNTGTLSFDADVSAGDTIDFVVGPRSIIEQDNYGCDSTALYARISEKGETPTSIPTLNEWGLIMLGLLLAGTTVFMIRKQRIQNN